MAKYTRKSVSEIVADENLTPEEKTERLFALYGQALDEGYVSRSAAQASLAAAVEKAKEDALKDVAAPDPKESDDYKALASEFAGYKAMQKARESEEFSTVKPKFFETVYGKIDHTEGAKPLKEQLAAIKEKYEEYFSEEKKPSFGGETSGSIPTGKGGSSFMDSWGFVPPKK